MFKNTAGTRGRKSRQTSPTLRKIQPNYKFTFFPPYIKNGDYHATQFRNRDKQYMIPERPEMFFVTTDTFLYQVRHISITPA